MIFFLLVRRHRILSKSGRCNRDRVSLCCPCWSAVATHRHDPTIDQQLSFDLLYFWPGQVHPSLRRLGGPPLPGGHKTQCRQPDWHRALQPRPPGLKRPCLSLPSIWDHRQALPCQAQIKISKWPILFINELKFKLISNHLTWIQEHSMSK